MAAVAVAHAQQLTSSMAAAQYDRGERSSASGRSSEQNSGEQARTAEESKVSHRSDLTPDGQGTPMAGDASSIADHPAG
jgi:uncharacterized low-complexity protein